MHYFSKASAGALVLVFCLLLSHPGYTQDDALDLSEDYIDGLDTLSIIQLIDSLLILDANQSSQLSLHFGYTSEVSNAGRTLEIKQYGFNPGITFIHRSGIYADVTGYWNSSLSPKYDLTVASLGYLGILSKRLSYSVSYDHSFFTDSDPDLDLPPILNNTLSGGLDLDFNFIETSVDYSWLFKDESAHRLKFALTGDLKKRDVLFFDRVSLRPSFSVLFGNQDIINISFSRDLIADRRFPLLINKDNAFGIMNYQFSIPLSLTKNNFLLVADYNYNLPQSLPGENFEYENNGFFSIDLYYTFAIASKKSIFE